MTPPAIVDAALAAGLDMIAVCDHNSARNVAAVRRGRRRARLGGVMLAGMEITTAEECHVVGLFPTAGGRPGRRRRGAAGAAARRRRLHAASSATSVLTADGDDAGAEPLALAMASALSLEQAVALVHRHGGLAVAAHIDRPSFGVIAQLGFFPLEAGFDAVELSRHVAAGSPDEAGYRRLGLPVAALVGRPLPRRHRRGAHRPGAGRRQLRRARAGAARRRRPERGRCMTSPCTCSTMLENSVRAGATVIAVSVDRRPPGATAWSSTVEDDGPGLPVSPEQVLDPFYTTKAARGQAWA